MAVGSFRVPLRAGGAAGINYTVDVFTASGTWTKPANFDYAYVLMIGGGGGAKAGRRGAASSNRGGGGSANGGGGLCIFLNSELSSTETVTVGAGGTGGIAQTTDNSTGASGSSGGSTEFKYGSTFRAFGGGGSIGGATSLVTSGALGSVSSSFAANPRALLIGLYNKRYLGTSAISDSDRAFARVDSNLQTLIMSSASVGGQINSSNTQIVSGVLGGFYDNTNTLIDEIAGTAAETAAVQPTQFYTFGQYLNKLLPWFDPADANYNIGRGGLGGGCGDTAGTVAGFAGAAGLGYGAPGGGGGASTNGANSGAGGNGTDGIVIIINVLT